MRGAAAGLGGGGAGRRDSLAAGGALPPGNPGPTSRRDEGAGSAHLPGSGLAGGVSGPGAAVRQQAPARDFEALPPGGELAGGAPGPPARRAGLRPLSQCAADCLRAGAGGLRGSAARGRCGAFSPGGGLSGRAAAAGGAGGRLVGVVRAKGHPHQPVPAHRPEPQGRVPGGPGHAPPLCPPPGGHQHRQDLRRVSAAHPGRDRDLPGPPAAAGPGGPGDPAGRRGGLQPVHRGGGGPPGGGHPHGRHGGEIVPGAAL